MTAMHYAWECPRCGAPMILDAGHVTMEADDVPDGSGDDATDPADMTFETVLFVTVECRRCGCALTACLRPEDMIDDCDLEDEEDTDA